MAQDRGVASLRPQETPPPPPLPASIDQPFGEDDDASVADFVLDSAERTPEQLTQDRLLRQEAERALAAALTPREQVVLQMRFGLGDGHVFPLERIGERLGLTRERVRQIEASALRKLRTPGVSDALRQYLSA
ncbi:MAG: sigma-70 family RNA polymerase sigma factor [Chloroflexota bacterium]